MTDNTEPLDLVWGVEEIGKVIGRTQQQTYNMIADGRLPIVKKMGSRYVVSRSKLVDFFMSEDAA
jgi:predicted DNA-binding transcriptional regulator AlpA